MRRKRKRAAAAIMSMFMALLCLRTVQADELSDQEAEKQAAYEVVPETNNIKGWPAGPLIYADSAIVMDMNSGAVVYGKKVDERHYPASITKLLTALVALENSKPDDEVYFSENSTSFLEYGDASIGMRPGEILSMDDALHGMLLASANEVSYAIAESVGKLMGGGYDTFIQKMNDRAAEIGCTGSHWVNANGLHDDQHYTTAHDMAVIASELYQFSEARTVMQTLNYTIGTTNLVNETRTFQQNHKMLWPGNTYYYEFCTGGKTGYTDQSGTTLVTMADNGTLQLAAVVLHDYGNDAYTDTRAMFDYVFNNFSVTKLAEQKKPEGIHSYPDEEAYVLLPEGIAFEDLDAEIEIVNEKKAEGKVTYYYQEQNVGSADVILTLEYVESKTGYSNTPHINGSGQTSGEDGTESQGMPLLVKVLIGVGTVIALLFILFAALCYRAAKKRQQRRIAKMRKRRQYEARRRREAHHPYDRRYGADHGYDRRQYGGRYRYDPRTMYEEQRRSEERRSRERDRNGRYR